MSDDVLRRFLAGAINGIAAGKFLHRTLGALGLGGRLRRLHWLTTPSGRNIDHDVTPVSHWPQNTAATLVVGCNRGDFMATAETKAPAKRYFQCRDCRACRPEGPKPPKSPSPPRGSP